MEKYSRVYVEITNICNRNCSFCPGTKREYRRMTMEEFSLACEKLSGLTDYIYLHVMGEPTTHPLLSDFISYATGKGFKVAVTTNGTLLAECGEEMINAGVYKVNISVHSFEEGTKKSYINYINTCMDFADIASSRGVLTVFRLWNRGYDKGRNIDTLALLRERFTEEWKEGARGARIRHKLHLEYGDRFDWPDIEAENMGERVTCYGLRDHFAILVDGRIVPCCLDREGEITLGNVYTDNITDSLSSIRATSMRDGFRDRCAVEELCQKCGYARRFKV